MVERSLSMREVPGSIPGASNFFFFVFLKYEQCEEYSIIIIKNSKSTSKVTPEMLERVHGNIVKRGNACLDANGKNFEHLI
jgi:hypothetical protein